MVERIAKASKVPVVNDPTPRGLEEGMAPCAVDSAGMLCFKAHSLTYMYIKLIQTVVLPLANLRNACQC